MKVRKNFQSLTIFMAFAIVMKLALIFWMLRQAQVSSVFCDKLII